MFGTKRKAEQLPGQPPHDVGRAGYDALIGQAQVNRQQASPISRNMILGGGAGTPCSSPFQPSPVSAAKQQQTAVAATTNNSKAAEAERKRAIESAAAKRCASGRIFPGTQYRLDMTIGKGSYGRVKLGTDMYSGQQVAIKFLAKDLMTKQAHWIRVKREINLLTLAHHPHIIKVHEWLESPEDVLIVMEYVSGKDLFDRINEKAEKRYGEAEARLIFRQMVSALDYCHQNRIVHRDLKPENVMIDSRGNVKLIDFGFANLFHPRDHLSTNCGSPLYAAPEIVQARPYIGPEVDVWSLGIVLYAMIVGALPFEDENLKGLYKKIGEGRFSFPDHVSPLARDLIQSMLQVNTLHRATMTHIRMHPWANEGIGAIPQSYVPLRPTHIANPREDLIRMLPEYGYNLSGDALRSTIIVQPDSPVFAGYCMLEEKEQREMRSCQEPISTGSSAIRIQPQPGRYVYGSPGKQQMASSLKEYRPIAPAIEPGLSEFEVQTPRYSVNLDTSAGHFSSIPSTPIKQQPIARIHNQTPSSLGIQHPSVSGTPGAGGHSNIMAQAAATVVNKFRRLKDIKLGFGSESPRASRRGSTPSNNIMQL